MTALHIAQVTSYTWPSEHEVNRFVERVSAELSHRGHHVLIVAPSEDGDAVRATRAALRGDPERLWRSDGAPTVLAIGEALPTSSRRAALPIDVTRSIETLQTSVALDICHVHEPFAPSVSSAALRHSRTLNVGTFHAPAERVVATQVARKVVELVLGRLDARTASYAATAQLLSRHFPAAYEVLRPGVDPVAVGERDREHIVFVDREERPALRVFLRALRRLPTDRPWHVTVLSARGPSSSTPLRAELRERVRFATPDELGEDALLAGAGILVAASDGTTPDPGVIERARAAGVAVVASRLPVYEEVLTGTDAGGRCDAGLLFEPRDTDTLAAQLVRALDGRVATPPPAPPRPWSVVTDELEAIYGRLVARRHGDGDPEVRRRISARALIDVDLHMHTDHSPDCATPVEVLLATARDQGLGAIAITDHNEVSGAFEAAAKAADFGVKVIVAEEIKTASQGEVIGLFLTEKIPRGLSMAQTVAEIKRQGGLVYVPHPFDRMHSVPDYEHLLEIVDDIDALEVFNPRVAIGSFNEEAARFAAKYRIVAGAGSDSHVAQGLGSVRIRMRDFDGPRELLESLREADIVRRPTSLLYVQALKFLETTAIPPGARRARRDRRVKRATRKS